MKTIAIDTNVLLAYYIKREPQYPVAVKLFQDCLERKVNLFLPQAALLETEWVLRSFYKDTKGNIIEFFQELLALENLKSSQKQLLQDCVTLYKLNNISFTDAVILSEVLSQNVDDFQSFDEKLVQVYLQEKV